MTRLRPPKVNNLPMRIQPLSNFPLRWSLFTPKFFSLIDLTNSQARRTSPHHARAAYMSGSRDREKKYTTVHMLSSKDVQVPLAMKNWAACRYMAALSQAALPRAGSCGCGRDTWEIEGQHTQKGCHNELLQYPLTAQSEVPVQSTRFQGTLTPMYDSGPTKKVALPARDDPSSSGRCCPHFDPANVSSRGVREGGQAPKTGRP